MTLKMVQMRKATLTAGISASDTSIQLSGFRDIHGTLINSMSTYFGTLAYITLNPRSKTNQEICSFTGITDNGDGTVTLTGVTRGLSPYSTYGTGGTARAHSGDTEVVVSNNPQFYNRFAIKDNNEAITGYWTVPDPVSATDIANKQWTLAQIASPATVSFDKICVAGTAGETVSAGQLLYFDLTDNEWKKCDADTAGSVNDVLMGIAQGAGTDGNSITGGVLLHGIDSNQSGMTQGDLQYASNTAGGISSSAGTVTRVIGVARNTTTMYFNPYFYYSLSAEQKAAVTGSQGVVGSSNKLITQDNTSESTTDQSQTTQDGSVETGEADATTKKNLIAQSFIPTKTKIRGVKLYKIADTGAFTGSVVVTLQADSSGSPSGSALATVTLTNAEWLRLAVGEFDAIFSSEYTALVAGSLYWIVIDPSTSDTSNHPNLGTNTAGGYSSGSLKYKNTTDSWVAISTIDLYFKTLEGRTAQIMKTNSDGKHVGMTKLPTVTLYDTASSAMGSSTTQFDITNPSGTTFRYTWDGIGTDPGITATTVPIGSLVGIAAQNFNSANNGVFVVTGSGTNYFEVTNASGVAENNVTIGTGYIIYSGTNFYSKIDNTSWLLLQVQGGGGGGDSSTGDDHGSGGGGGGFLEKYIDGASLPQRMPYLVAPTATSNVDGKISAFAIGATIYYANGGLAGTTDNGGAGGSASGGDINIPGGDGHPGNGNTSTEQVGGSGGDSFLGRGGRGASETGGSSGSGYGGGGGGAADTSTNQTGGTGAKGCVKLIAHF